MDARPAYLAEVCNGDEALRHEVELVLSRKVLMFPRSVLDIIIAFLEDGPF